MEENIQNDQQSMPGAPSPDMESMGGEIKSKKGVGFTVLWIVVLLIILSPLVYNYCAAAIANPDRPSFTFSGWFSGSFQQKVDREMRTASRLSGVLFPLKNQLDFELFGKIRIHDCVMGKNNNIINLPDVDEYLGRNDPDPKYIAELLRKAKVVQDTLKKKNIDLLLVYVPSKEYFMPEEVVPDKYLDYDRKKTDYDMFVESSKALDVDFMDFYPILDAARKITTYPLYPQSDLHWSDFAQCLAADTLTLFIEQLRHTKMPHIYWDTLGVFDTPRVHDAVALNDCSLFRKPKLSKYAYPLIRYRPSADSPVKVLGIGDSYYQCFINLNLLKNSFGSGEYWYYYNSVFSAANDKKEVWEYDLKSKIEENNVIVLLNVSGNLNKFGHGFIEDAYQLYTDPQAYYTRVKKERPFKEKLKLIHQSPDLLDEVRRFAEENAITFDSALNYKAKEMVTASAQ